SVMLFSSRSRRQSFCGDWSSDVCSSDLLLHVLLASYEEQQLEREKRVVLHLKPSLAPVKAAVLPLLRNRPELVEVARRLASELKPMVLAVYDDTASIGKLNRRQDEIGTPFCVTVDV